jgi:hypothetical protein
MSGSQVGGCRFKNALTLLMNFELPTTYRYHMPYVVGYVVSDVVPDVERGQSRRNFPRAVLNKFPGVDQRIGRDAALAFSNCGHAADLAWRQLPQAAPRAARKFGRAGQDLRSGDCPAERSYRRLFEHQFSHAAL